MNLRDISVFNDKLDVLPDTKLVINTINAHSFNIAKKDRVYAEALASSGVLLPDGVSVVMAKRILNNVRLSKIAGADLFYYEMNRLNKMRGKCLFLGSSEKTLARIKDKAAREFPDVEVFVYSPPYVDSFSEQENKEMIAAVNNCSPDVLFIGMTAPKQEKWAYLNAQYLNTKHICSIGAVFDFYAGTVKRAPIWIINLGFEWFYRLVKEPKRLWRRYIIGNTLFLRFMFTEKLQFMVRNTRMFFRVKLF